MKKSKVSELKEKQRNLRSEIDKIKNPLVLDKRIFLFVILFSIHRLLILLYELYFHHFSSLSFDLLSLSGHKIGAPKGIGLLYIKEGTALTPLIDGGGQEKRKRGGTENLPYIVGLATALEEAKEAAIMALS